MWVQGSGKGWMDGRMGSPIHILNLDDDVDPLEGGGWL